MEAGIHTKEIGFLYKFTNHLFLKPVEISHFWNHSIKKAPSSACALFFS